MDNSKNLVIGLSVGVYSAVQHIESFIVSLRKYYDGPVCMIIDEKSDAMVDFLKKYDVDISFVKVKLTPESVMYNRWVLPRKVLIEKYKNIENVLLPDTRDLVFQDNPFKFLSGKSLDLSVETKKIQECSEYNTRWVRNLYGEEVYEKIKDEWILCAGVTGGKRDAVIELCDVMIAERQRFGDRFVDQCTLNVFYNEGKLPDAELHYTGEQLVATIGHSFGNTMIMEDGILTGKHKSIVPAMVHQYDRHKSIEHFFIENAIKPL